MLSFYPWIVYLHLFAAFVYMLVHGVEAAVMWHFSREADPERSLTFFNSLPRLTLLRVVFAWLVISGLVAGFMVPWWRQGWMWTSLAILIVMGVLMNRFGNAYFNQIARTAGGAIHEKNHETNAHTGLEAFHKARRSWHPPGVTVIGLVGLGLILWLMMFKPF
jgi:hypothetical protein